MGVLDESVRPLWTTPHYHNRMGSAAVVAPPPNDFIRVYRFEKSKYAIQTIENSRLKVSTLGELNDPLEISGLNLGDRAQRRIIDAYKADFEPNFGILCFTSDWVSPAFWAHYGDRHTGICLGFNVRAELLHYVNYLKRRMVLPPSTRPDDPLVEQLLLYSKAECWSFEEEIRSKIRLPPQDPSTGRYFTPFCNDIQLAEVICGIKCSEDWNSLRRKVNALHPSVVTFSTRVANQWFSIVPNEESLPAK